MQRRYEVVRVHLGNEPRANRADKTPRLEFAGQRMGSIQECERLTRQHPDLSHHPGWVYADKNIPPVGIDLVVPQLEVVRHLHEYVYILTQKTGLSPFEGSRNRIAKGLCDLLLGDLAPGLYRIV